MVVSTRTFRSKIQQTFGMCRAQQWLTTVATEGHKVQITDLLMTLQSPGHN